MGYFAAKIGDFVNTKKERCPVFPHAFIIFLLVSFLLGGCTKLMTTYTIEKSGDYSRYITPQFYSMITSETNFLAENAEVTLTLKQKAYQKEKGKEFIDMDVFESRYYFLPLSSQAICEEKPRFCLILMFLALDYYYINNNQFPLTAAWFSLDSAFSLISLFNGGYPGRNWESEKKSYKTWALDRDYKSTLPLKFHDVEISVPVMSYIENSKTNADGQFTLDLKKEKLIPIEPKEITVYFKYSDPGGIEHQETCTISETDVATLGEFLE